MQRLIMNFSFILFTFLTLMLTGCASFNMISNSDSATSINQVQKTQYGTIAQARPVQVTSNANTGGTGNQTVTQYVVKLENGGMVSVIQGGPPYQVGQRVTVTSNGSAPVRITPA